MVRPTFALLASLLCASAGGGAPADDRSALLQGKMQLMGHAAEEAEVSVKASAATDSSSRLRSSLAGIFRVYATGERAEELAGLLAAALARGEQATGLPAEADAMGWQLLDLATEVVRGAPATEAWATRASYVAEMMEALAERAELAEDYGRRFDRTLTWASNEISDLLQTLVPGQPVAAMGRGFLSMARDYAVKVHAREQVTGVLNTIDALLQRGDFGHPMVAVRGLQEGLDSAALHVSDEVPFLGRLMSLVRYAGAALEADGREPASWSEALEQISNYVLAGNLPPLAPPSLQLLQQMHSAATADEAQAMLVQAFAGLVKDHGEQLGAKKGIVRGASNLFHMVEDGTAHLTSAQDIADTLKRAAGEALPADDEPVGINLQAEDEADDITLDGDKAGEGTAPAAGGSGMLAVLGVPEWGIDFGTKLAAVFFDLFRAALGQGQPPSLAELLGGLVPPAGRHALDGALAGDGRAMGSLMRSWAQSLREGADPAGH
mmetsp:Transcript_901/g.2689  ORF Transcript_901/g.2689 Transcript_901/m.2689 type:complete len:494 (-) Transcript_901:92-1573(-)